jgi:hypothetical protein
MYDVVTVEVSRSCCSTWRSTASIYCTCCSCS